MEQAPTKSRNVWLVTPLDARLGEMVRGKMGNRPSRRRGESTSTVADMFRISAGRISQVRGKLAEAWKQCHDSLDFEAELAVA